MPAIAPLRGVRYAPSVIRRMDRVVTPPYDVISPAAQDAFYRRSPYNFIRIVYGRGRTTDRPGRDRYTRAHDTFQTWLREGVLRMEAAPACYPYRQRFLHAGQSFDRWGLIALIRLGEPSIFRHEDTYAAPKQDRFQLLQAVQANLSPIFGLVDDPTQAYRAVLARSDARPPLASVRSDDVQHDLWRITQPALIQRLQTVLEAKAMLIADGHHRYESALAYRDALRRQWPSFTPSHPANFILAYLAVFDAHDPGILPTHRVFGGLTDWSLDRLAASSVVEVARVADETAMRAALEHWSDPARPALGCYAGSGRWAVVSPAQVEPSARLDVEVLHRVIVPRCVAPVEPAITYTHVWADAVRQVDAGQGQVAWYLRSLTVAEILRCVRDGRRLPQKSTYFIPKPLSGLVVHRLTPPGVPSRRAQASLVEAA